MRSSWRAGEGSASSALQLRAAGDELTEPDQDEGDLSSGVDEEALDEDDLDTDRIADPEVNAQP